MGHGTRFAISVPISDAAAPAPRSGFELAIPAAYGRMDVPVIVIDNDLAVLEAMQSLLKRWGADVRLARDLEDIGDIMGKGDFKPAIVLADFHLDDGVCGLDAVKRIRVLQNEDIPAILITADRTNETAEAAQKEGCELLHKPVKPAELRALMQHLLK